MEYGTEFTELVVLNQDFADIKEEYLRVVKQPSGLKTSI